MPMHEEPVVGAVYEDEDGRTFEVTAFDENEGTIEVEYEDGTPDEFDLDDWYGMDLELLESEDEDEDEEAEEDDSGKPDDDTDLDEDEDDLDEDEEE